MPGWRVPSWAKTSSPLEQFVGLLVMGQVCYMGGRYQERRDAGQSEKALRKERWCRDTRRIVTGHDASGRAVVLEDRAAPSNRQPPGQEGVQVSNLWRMVAGGDGLSQTAPGSERGKKKKQHLETAGESIPLHPPAGGNVFRVVQFSPGEPPNCTFVHSDSKAATYPVLAFMHTS